MMKIKIYKRQAQISEQKEVVNEALPAVLGAVASKVPWKKIGKGLLSMVGGGSDEKEAEMEADAIHQKAEEDPLDVESGQMAMQIRLLAQANETLKSIEDKIGQLPQDPDVMGSNTPDSPSAPAPEKSAKPKPDTFKVVKEIKLKINKKAS
tara:strand:+ start:417 stop:869 length:453 start_codon:yes stop_codon:yes gene_type:complete